MEEKNHIYPIFDRMMTRQDKEELLGQHSVMIWFTGLSGSGKSTIAIALERELHKRGLLCRILDGDNIRSGINNNLGFSETDRVENIRRIAEVSKLFLDSGIITIAAFISPNNDIREMAANIIGKDDFLEIFVRIFCVLLFLSTSEDLNILFICFLMFVSSLSNKTAIWLADNHTDSPS